MRTGGGTPPSSFAGRCKGGGWRHHHAGARAGARGRGAVLERQQLVARWRSLLVSAGSRAGMRSPRWRAASASSAPARPSEQHEEGRHGEPLGSRGIGAPGAERRPWRRSPEHIAVSFLVWPTSPSGSLIVQMGASQGHVPNAITFGGHLAMGSAPHRHTTSEPARGEYGVGRPWIAASWHVRQQGKQ